MRGGDVPCFRVGVGRTIFFSQYLVGDWGDTVFKNIGELSGFPQGV